MRTDVSHPADNGLKKPPSALSGAAPDPVRGAKRGQQSRVRSGGVKTASGIAALAAVYALTAGFGLTFNPVGGFATLVWPPAGIALAVLLRFGLRFSPGIFAGAAVINALSGAPVSVAAAIGIGNMLEAAVAAYVLKRAGFNDDLKRPIDVVMLALFAGVGSTMIAATVGVTILSSAGILANGEVAPAWLAWWVGDMLGILIITPFLLLWLGHPPFRSLTAPVSRTIALEIVAIAVTGAFIFVEAFTIVPLIALPAAIPVDLILLVPLIWMAVRFGRFPASAVLVFVSAAAVWQTTRGQGPFIIGEENILNLFMLQISMAVTAFIILMFAALGETLTNAREEVLRLSMDRHKTLIEAAPDIIFTARADGNILALNAAFEPMLGWQKEEWIGSSIMPLVHPEDAPRVEERLQALARGETLPPAEFRLKAKNGSYIPVEGHARPYMRNGKTVEIIGIYRNITRRKNLERDLAAHSISLETTVREQTTQLRDRIKELERMNRLMVERELKMAELKSEIERIRNR